MRSESEKGWLRKKGIQKLRGESYQKGRACGEKREGSNKNQICYSRRYRREKKKLEKIF